jgi:hypothetical protein
MALSAIQRDVCQLLAARRRARGNSYVAGGVALSVALETQRQSRDLDIFHDTTEAVSASFDADRDLLLGRSYRLTVLRQQPGYIEAEVERDAHRLVVEWARDSAFRFFPLVEHDELGLMLHPFDLATNKVLALVGRLEPRDWVDVIACHERLQPLGYLAWAACGKDPGFTPLGIIEQSLRSGRYSEEEIRTLAFGGTPPKARTLSVIWHAATAAAREIIDHLPAERIGHAVLGPDGGLFGGDPSALKQTIAHGQLHFHAGRLGGALPVVTQSSRD